MDVDWRNWEINRLLETYNHIKERILYHKFDSFDVVKAVVKHRNFWKPPIVKTILLAESHVYTTDEDLSNNLSYPENIEFADLPTQFVRLVYCLGYGEQKYLAPGIGDRKETPQFWKIFAACAADMFDLYDYETNKILKGTCPSFMERSLNKVKLLNKLANKGVWLLDSSIVGLYRSGEKPPPHIRSEVISICWDNYISALIKRAKPTFIIVIGHEVASILKVKLDKIKLPYEVIYQPNAILKKSKRNLKRDYITINKICNGEYSTSKDIVCEFVAVKDQDQFNKEEEDRNMPFEKNIEIEENVLLLTINKLYGDNMSDPELYEATRGVWIVGPRREKAEFAFSLYEGIVKEVYIIKKWHKARTLEYKHRDPSTLWGTGRWEFEGEIASEEIRSKYINKSVRQYVGGQNPIKYVNC